MASASGGLRRVAAHALRQQLRENQKPLLGVDVGSYRCGFAIAPHIDAVAIPLKVVKRRNLDTSDVSSFLESVVRAHDVGGLVVGWPLQVDGTEGVSCHRVRRFVRQVSREVAGINLPYTLFDESNTTVDAYDDLKDSYGPECVIAVLVVAHTFTLWCVDIDLGPYSSTDCCGLRALRVGMLSRSTGVARLTSWQPHRYYR